MATERVLALATLVAVSCSPVVDRCQSGTLLVSVTLAGSAAGADQLVVDIALDGGAAHESTLAHTPGVAAGNVVVQFPSGYPRGHHVDVTVTASSGGVVLGSADAIATLADACAVAPLTVADNGGGGDDLSVAGDLGGGGDLAGPPDLTPPHDLATGPDLWTGCTPTGAENCFNGIDDDCNGHIDCDDPNCAPVAVCVPTAGAPFAYITEEAAGGTCAADTTSGGTLYVSNPSGGGCNAGNCGCDTHGCTATITRDDNCPSGSGTTAVATLGPDTCTMNLSGQNNLFVSMSGSISCSATGATTPVNPPTLTKALRCSVNAVGGGCTANHVCAPRGSQQCVIAGGSQTCPGGYPNIATWYTSFTDNRSCSCSCAPSSCSSAGLRGYPNNLCSGAGTSQGNDICSNDYQFWKVGGGCAPTPTLGGTTIQFNGASTVCCE
jgi:hypothetical protein